MKEKMINEMKALDRKIARMSHKKAIMAVDSICSSYGTEAFAEELYDGFYRNIHRALN